MRFSGVERRDEFGGASGWSAAKILSAIFQSDLIPSVARSAIGSLRGPFLHDPVHDRSPPDGEYRAVREFLFLLPRSGLNARHFLEQCRRKQQVLRPLASCDPAPRVMTTETIRCLSPYLCPESACSAHAIRCCSLPARSRFRAAAPLAWPAARNAPAFPRLTPRSFSGE